MSLSTLAYELEHELAVSCLYTVQVAYMVYLFFFRRGEAESVNNIITIQLWAHMRTAQNKTGVHKLQKYQSETCTVSIVITVID